MLVRPADVYLLDEPLSHLDAKLRAAMRAELKQLGEMSSTTSLYVTHDYQEALALGDRIAVLRDGRLVQIGTPRADLAAARPTPSSPSRSGSQRSTCSTGEVVRGTSPGSGRRDLVPVPARARPASRGPGPARAAPQRPAPGSIDAFSSRNRCGFEGRSGSRSGSAAVELTVDVGGELVVHASSEHGVAEGERIRLQIPLEHVHVFAAAEGDDETPRLAQVRRNTRRSPTAAMFGEG